MTLVGITLAASLHRGERPESDLAIMLWTRLGKLCRSSNEYFEQILIGCRYVNANYRFVVDPRKTYEAQVVDPDATVDWDSVLQILVSARTQDSSCPICLDTPIAARMARCGHVFCLPCLTRYMHSGDDQEPRPDRRSRCKSCPICHDMIYMHEARPVKWFVGQENEPPMEGQDMILRLMVSMPGRVLALPRDCAGDLVSANDIPSRNAAEVMDYARTMKGSQDYMHSEYDREIEELNMQEESDTVMFEEDPQWTQKAIRSVLEAQQRLDQIGNPPDVTLSARPRPLPRLPRTIEETSPSLSAQLARTSMFDSARDTPTMGTEDYRYFYQGLLHNYLAALDVRILRAAFGHWSSFPSKVLPRVLHVSTGHVVDEVLKKRSRFLAHLPMGCEVTFLECDWTDIVPTEVLEQFRPELEKREKRNQEKAVREERDRVRVEKEEDDKRWAAARRRRPEQMPETYTISEVKSYAHSGAAAGAGIPSFEALPRPFSPIRPNEGSSFAPLGSLSTSPPAPRTVWGTAVVQAASPTIAADEPLPSTEADDGWLMKWERDMLSEGPADESPSAAGGSTKKKGKKQKITLMSTTGRRAA